MSLTQHLHDSTLVLTIDRPAAKNAINLAVATELHEAIATAHADETIRAIVLTASGGDVFVAGGDLKEFQHLAMDETGAQHIIDLGVRLECIETGPLPVIAAVQGDVLGGGCELLVLCDLVVMEEHAGIEFRHARMGLTPAWGGTTRLGERVGALTAAELLLTARRVEAREARQLGLASRVVDRGEALRTALDMAGQLAQPRRAAVAAIKRSLLASRRAQRGDALVEEKAVFREVWGGASSREALQAFMKRR